MFKRVAKFFFIFLAFFTFEQVRAQLTITSNSLVACIPGNISFSVVPVVPGATYNWNFGNSITSTLQYPNVAYTSQGVYVVNCTVTAGGSPTVCAPLTVTAVPKPTPNFSFSQPSSGCAPKTVTFTNSSSAFGSGSIVNSSWVFGNGSPASNVPGTNSTNYTYSTAGNYSVTLQVTDSYGCSNNITIGSIPVSTPPNVIISSNPPILDACSAPFTAAFSASNSVTGSPTGGGLTYNWNFGNSQTSTQQTPGNITYNTQGIYTVSLTATDNNNCSKTVTTSVSVNQPSLALNIASTLCVNQTFTMMAQSNKPLVNWNMGNTVFTVTPSNSLILMTPYTSPGVYTITASTQPAPGSTCIATITKTIMVEQVVANFTFTPPSFTCSPTFTASYINQSSPNAVSFTWTAANYNGGSTSTSTLTNPTFTFVQGSLNPYTIYNTFSPAVSLIATSAAGCTSTITVNVFDSIRRPTAWFNKDKKEGCAPLVVKFRDSSFTNTTIYPITSYTWNNGANPPTFVTGTVPPPIVNPTFTYNSPGTYTPYLIIQTATGCIDTSFVDTITVVNPPTISFNFTPSVACWNQPVQIINTSPTTTPSIQHWHVDSDDHFFSGCVSDPNPSWNFTHVGVHTFTVSGYLNSCKSSNTSTASVTINGPIVRSRFETNCTNRKSVSFFSHLQDAQAATLNFGDNSFVSITGTPGGVATHSVAHTYSASGNYTAVITASNSITGCAPNTFTMLIKVRDAVANFTVPAVVCTSVALTFDGSSSQDVLVGCNRGYQWFLDSNPPNDTTSSSVVYTFASPGTHTMLLVVKDENSCGDTTKKTFRVSSASPSFSFSANPICLSNGTVTLVNTTTGVPDPITGYQWNFGDGSPLSSATSPTHTYGSATPPGQTYTVTLSATNSYSCTDVVSQVIQVNNPIATLNASPNFPCAGVPVVFTAPPGYTSYTFGFGAGTTTLSSTSNTVSYTYSTTGSFSPTLTVVDAGGCVNTTTIAFPLTVQSTPTANFTFSSPNATGTNNICSGSIVNYTSTSQSPFTLNYAWNIATINSSVVTNFIPATQSGTTAVTLTVSTVPNGCSATITKTLNIYKADANLNLDKATVCLGNSISFNVKDTNSVYSWTWFFGDGDTLKGYAGSSPPNISHTFLNYPLPSGSTTVTLIYYSSQYACKYAVTQPIQIVKISADFDRNNEINKVDSVHCVNIQDMFSNTTPGSSGFSFNWSFGDGGTSSVQNPTHLYPSAGVYQVTLTITDPVNNCIGFTIKNMTINPLPSVTINANDSVCQNAPFNLIGNASSNVTSYTWTPATGLATPNSQTTAATATVSPVQYSLAVTDANGCTNATSKNIYVQLPPPNISWDTTIIIGQATPLSGYAGTNFNYTWTPTIDLTCISCPNPISTSTANITYSVTIADGLGCFRTTNTFTVYVEPKSTVDVPTAFTPNGDGTNDVIYVDGWGIRKLNYFRIFNRWGQLLFESNDIKTGWDGNFNGVPQNMETYVYQVSVETYVDKDALLKTGTFKLIR